jgi:serine/threonine-protein kinase
MMPDDVCNGAHTAQPPAPGNRWQEVSGIVDEALELPVEQRARFLARACPSDDLRMEVDRFLAACERSGGFLEGAATTFAAPLLANAASPRAEDEAAALTLLRDALAGRYTIEHELGRGGMALVYLARDVRLNREVAVKLLRPEIAATLGAERFLREIETTARLTHPNILPLLDSGEAQGLLYFVMPFVTGETRAAGSGALVHPGRGGVHRLRGR